MRKEIPLVQRILDTAETVLRRHGPNKTNVVDIARTLGMSHSNVYRHFPSKKALLDAVAARWLHALTDPLEVIATDRARPAAERLTAWFNHLRKTKQRKMIEEPALFQVHLNVVEMTREVVSEHLRTMHNQVERIIADGVAAGEFSGTIDPTIAARAFLHATAAFHHPTLVRQKPPSNERDARAVLNLLLAGLRAGAT